MEQRLIDANKLERWLKTSMANENSLHCDVKGTYSECITMVHCMETVDAVEVVRCRECKESEPLSVLDTDCLYCGVWDTAVHFNGYCYHGARMDGGAEK